MANSDLSYSYHSVIFGDKNTFDDWHLVPTSRPLFSVPKQKTTYVDIPGASGSIDLSESLTGYPVFNDREGSMSFYVLNGLYSGEGDYWSWSTAYSTIMNYLHGQTMRCYLLDDPEWFYEGRFTVNQWASNKDYSQITIDYRVSPYKWSDLSTTDDWKWDSFNFETGMIYTDIFKDISVDSSSTWTSITYSSEYIGHAPICPSFTVNVTSGTDIQMRIYSAPLNLDYTVSLKNGYNAPIDEVFFAGEETTLYFKGVGNVTIDFRPGVL